MIKRVLALFATLALVFSIAACDVSEPAAQPASHGVHIAAGSPAPDSPNGGGTSAPSESRPAYEVLVETTQGHAVSKHHAKETAAPSEAALERELEAAYGFDINVDGFTDRDFNTFYSRYGYSGLPGDRDAYVLNIMSNVKQLFPAIPIEVVQYMDDAVNLTIIVSIDRGEGADGIYYAETNTIYLMYEGKAVVHEYGHMLHYAIMGVVGEGGFELQWTTLNEGLSYNSGRGGLGVYDFETGGGAQGAVFYGDYATTDIYEDVAETFWMMIERPHDLERLVAVGAPLAKKAALLDTLLRDTLLASDMSVVTLAFEEYASYAGGYGGDDGYDEYDLDGDGYCDDCGEWLGMGPEPGVGGGIVDAWDDWGDWDDWTYEDDWYDMDWWRQGDAYIYDLNGDGYCDDCGEWLGW